MLSIIVPVYNDEKYLKECLRSIFNSNYHDFEVIIVNDCSTDRSLEVAGRFPCRIEDLKTNKGVAFARNRGAEVAKGDVLVFFDSDVVLEKDSLSKFARAHENPEVKIYQCQIYHKSLTPGFTPQVLATLHNYLLSLMGNETSYIQSFAFSIDKAVFFEIGGFNTKFKTAGGEEFEIGEIIQQHNYKMILDQSFHIYHHFQTFLPRFKKLFRRSYLYGRIVLRRNFKLDKGYGTAKDGINSILAAIGILSLIGSLFMHYLIFVFFASTLMQAFLERRLYMHIAKKKGMIFLIKSIPIIYLWYLAMGLGIIRAGLAHYFQKVFKAFAKFKFLFSKTPAYVIFLVTNKCNARCKHCFNWKKVQNQESSKDLSLEEIKKISSNFDRIKYMTYGGGEPSIRESIIDITQSFYENNHLEILNFITNGFATELLVKEVKKILRTCPDMRLIVGFSIDGIGKQHDEIRNTPGGFEKLLRSIDEMKRLQKHYSNLKLLATSVYSKFNKDNIFEIVDYITKKLKLEMVLTYVRGETFDKNATDVDVDTYIKATDKIRQINANNCKRIDFIRAIDNICFKLVAETKNKKKRIINCMAGKKFIEITNDGMISPCEMLNIDFGNIRDHDYNIKKVLSTKKSESFSNFLKRGNCFCTWECAMKNNIIYSVSKYPSLCSELLKQVLKGLKGCFKEPGPEEDSYVRHLRNYR